MSPTEDRKKMFLITSLVASILVAITLVAFSQYCVSKAVAEEQEFLSSTAKQAVKGLDLDTFIHFQYPDWKDNQKIKDKFEQILAENPQISQIFLFQKRPDGRPEFDINLVNDPTRYLDSTRIRINSYAEPNYVLDEKARVGAILSTLPSHLATHPLPYLGIVLVSDRFYMELEKAEKYKFAASIFVLLTLFLLLSPRLVGLIKATVCNHRGAFFRKPGVASYLNGFRPVAYKQYNWSGSLKPVLSGELQDVELNDVLQMLHLALKTGRLEVRNQSGKPGVIYIMNGEVVHAAYKDLWGESAVRALLLKERGAFEFFVDEKTKARSISMSTPHLLLRAAKGIGERAKLTLVTNLYKRGSRWAALRDRPLKFQDR